MAEEVKDAPAVESKETKTVEAKTEVPTKETEKAVKVGEGLKVDEPKQEAKMVPEAILIEYKKEAKEVQKELAALKKSIEEGSTKKEVTASVRQLMDEYPDSKEFIEKFHSSLRAEIEAEQEARLKPIKDKETMEMVNKVFDAEYEKAIAENPEYAKLVNKESIRTLTFNPQNANKDLTAKLIQNVFESSYGHLVTGKKTLEPTKARGGAQDTTIDSARAKTDSKYFEEIMADPELKKQYNSELINRIRL